jgi:hypothetical protein
MQPLYCRIQLLFYLAAFHPILVLQWFSVVVVAEDSSSSSVVWDKYAISPRKCIYFNNQDVIIYSMFDNGNTVCSGQAAGLYYTDVPTFVNSYSYQEPSVASYLTCTLYEQNGQNVRKKTALGHRYLRPNLVGHCSKLKHSVSYSLPIGRLLLVAAQIIYIIIIYIQVYSQLGCSKSSVHNLTVNLYSDSTCTTRVPYSSDTISADLSDFSVRIGISSILILLSLHEIDPFQKLRKLRQLV